MSLYKGQSLYHVVSQNALGSWLGKNIYISRRFVWPSACKEDPISKEKYKEK